MKKKQIILWSVFVLIVVVVGVLTHSLWVSLFTFGGLLALNNGYDWHYIIVRRQYKRYFVEYFLGLILLGVATWLSKLEGRWIWTLIWMLAALPLFIAGVFMHRKVPRWSWIIAFIAGALCAIFAIVSPFIHYGLLTSPSFHLWLLIWLLLLFGSFLILAIKAMGVRDKIVLSLAFSLLLSIVIILWIATRNIWVSLLTFAGMWLLFKNLHRILEGAIIKYQRFFISSIAGLILIGCATWLDQLHGGWIWTPIWILAAIPLIFEGAFLYNNKSNSKLYTNGMALSSRVALGVSALCILFALTGPSILSGMPFMNGFFTFLLLASGFIFVILAWSEGGGGEPISFITFVLLGTILLGSATFYSQFADRWMWTFFWLIGAILVVFGARGVFKYTRGVGLFGYIISIAYAIFALTVPLYSNSYLSIVGEILSGTQKNYAALEPVIIVLFALIICLLVAFVIVQIFKPRMVRKKMEKIEPIIPHDHLIQMIKYMSEKDKASSQTRTAKCSHCGHVTTVSADAAHKREYKQKKHPDDIFGEKFKCPRCGKPLKLNYSKGQK